MRTERDVQFRLLQTGSKAVLMVTGFLDWHGSEALAAEVEKLARGAVQTVVVDLGCLRHIHFRSVEKLRRLAEEFRSRGKRLEFRGLSPYLARIFAVGGFVDIADYEAAMPPGLLGIPFVPDRRNSDQALSVDQSQTRSSSGSGFHPLSAAEGAD